MKIDIKEWESNHFGFTIADLSTTIDEYDKSKIESIINSYKIDLLQINVGLADIALIQMLESDGFIFADIRCEYSVKTINIPGNPAEINIASSDDINQLIAISKNSIKYSRYFNKFFNKENADCFYQIWIEKSVSAQFDDICLINREDDIINGFITLKKINNTGKIGLIAVSTQYQNIGVGSKLLTQGLTWLQKNNLDELSVVTQGVNITAQRFYQKNGFRLNSISCWLYKQFTQ